MLSDEQIQAIRVRSEIHWFAAQYPTSDGGKTTVCTRQDMRAVLADRTELLARIAELESALQTLMEEQNGPPLIRHADSWQSAMDVAAEVLRKGKT